MIYICYFFVQLWNSYHSVFICDYIYDVLSITECITRQQVSLYIDGDGRALLGLGLPILCKYFAGVPFVANSNICKHYIIMSISAIPHSPQFTQNEKISVSSILLYCHNRYISIDVSMGWNFP